ncbi:MAG: hypothetical protein ABIH35_00825 [Patescibacteria group bacterium]
MQDQSRNNNNKQRRCFMKRREWAIVVLILAAAVVAAGCSKKQTLNDLCAKQVAETKADLETRGPEVVKAFGDDYLKEQMNTCMSFFTGLSSHPKGTEALAAYASHILNACKGKSGKDWLTCQGKESPAGADAMNEILK